MWAARPDLLLIAEAMFLNVAYPYGVTKRCKSEGLGDLNATVRLAT